MSRQASKKSPDLTTTDDGLCVRQVGDWSKEKLHYVARYMDMFTTSMRKKWVLVYVDLFAGPGKSKVKNTGEVVKGSPLLALDLPYRFNKYIFVETDPKSLSALEKRIAAYRDHTDIYTKETDCNMAAAEIASLIPSDALTLAFIDPEGCDIHFATIKALADSRRVDLLMTFPMGMDIKRNVDTDARHPGNDWTRFDHFFGTTDWRRTYLTAFASGGWKVAIQKIMEFYKDQLKDLGYKEIKTPLEKLIRETHTDVPLYYLLFASKNRLGTDFWKKVLAKSPSGQIGFKFDQ